jgi:hypothetical protein
MGVSNKMEKGKKLLLALREFYQEDYLFAGPLVTWRLRLRQEMEIPMLS